jgi:hypothetical protein
MRMTLRVSHPAMPGVPVTGQPLAHDPQTMQTEKSNLSKTDSNSGLMQCAEELTVILARWQKKKPPREKHGQLEILCIHIHKSTVYVRFRKENAATMGHAQEIRCSPNLVCRND